MSCQWTFRLSDIIFLKQRLGSFQISENEKYYRPCPLIYCFSCSSVYSVNLKRIKPYLQAGKLQNINCIMLGIILNCLICVIKLLVSSVCAREHQQICEICTEETLCCTTFYSNSVKQLCTIIRTRVLEKSKWRNGQMNIYAICLYFPISFQKEM